MNIVELLLKIYYQIGASVEKNIKRLISSKISAAMIIFGPLVMILIIGAAFQGSGFYGIKIGIYSPSYNNISDSIIESIKKSDFEVIKLPTLEKCIEEVKEGRNHLCITFPEDFKTGKMDFYVDMSRINIVYGIISKLSSQVDSLSSQISLGATQDLLDTISFASDQMQNGSIIIGNLKNESGTLVSRLNEIRIAATSFDPGANMTTIEDILDENSEINQNMDVTKQDIKDLKRNITDLKNTLHKFNISAFDSDLNNIDNRLDFYDYQINQMRSNLRTGALQTKKNIETARALQTGLSQSLIQINDEVNNNSAILEKMLSSLNETAYSFDLISMIDANSVVKPIKTAIKSLESKKLSTLDILFPGILVMIVMFVGLLIGNTLVMREKTSKAYFRNLILPVKHYVFIVGTYLTNIIITLIQVLVIIGIAAIFFNLKMQMDLSIIILLAAISIILFSSIGMIIGYLAQTEEISILSSILLSVLMLWFSNLVIPVENMTQAMGTIARMTPFNIIELMLRKSLIHGLNPFQTDQTYLLILIIEVTLLVATVFYVHKRTIEKASK